MATQPVHPLRIQKSAPSSSPVKMGSSTPRALTELAPTEQRRNSPNLNQGSPKKMAPNMDSSPFQSSPFNASEGNSSPRLFWQGRDTTTPNRFNSENGVFGNRELSPSPTRRSSIERLQRASRVKNSNMFAREQKQEYDPTSMPNIERPLAKQIQGNAYGGLGLDGLRSEERGRAFGHARSPSKDIVSPYLLSKLQLSPTAVRDSPAKDHTSAMKSSLVSSRFGPNVAYDEDKNGWPEDNSGGERELPEGRSLHRHAKSVTFDVAPPQINEYEMVTPDLSSVGTNSRENSYDSAEDDEEESYNRSGSLEIDDSFDASLEDTDKTPVVGPDDWRYSNTPSNIDNMDLYGTQLEMSSPASGHEASSPEVNRNISGDHRPLPPLPGVTEKRHSGLFAAAERANNVQRSPHGVAAASFSKSDIQGLTGGRMPLEERLRLMMIQDDDKAKPVAETQRERRMRRGGARDRCSATPEADEAEIKIHEDEDTLADLGDYQLPDRISRESILRKVNGHDTFALEPDYNFSSPPATSRHDRIYAPDPDVPIQSTEDASVANDDSVIIKPEEGDSEVDVYSIPEMYQSRSESRQEDYSMNNSITDERLNTDEDQESQYSDQTPIRQTPELEHNSPVENDGPPTPRAETPKSDTPAVNMGDKHEQALLSVLSDFSGNNNFSLGLQSYMTPTPPPPPPEGTTIETLVAPIEALETGHTSTPPDTPSQYALPKPDYDGAGWGSEDENEAGTPESVVHHAVSFEASPPRDSPAIPEKMATIKASSGSKLKTRPSATPSDLMAMKEARRQISTEYPIPPIPQRHRNRPSLSPDHNLEDPAECDAAEEKKRVPSVKRDGLTLDIGSDLGLSLDKDFDRLIEAQKVAFTHSHYSPNNLEHCFGQVSTSQTGRLQSIEYRANVTPWEQRGYLMRQNTKVVVASSGIDTTSQGSRDTRSAGNSPVKQTRPQSWTVEPWNGSPRKKSMRDSMGGRKKIQSGPTPPLPGQQSNVAGLARLTEDDAQVDVNEGENGERGRLFVKVIGVKDLGLPLPKNERTWFALTLDNGVHCVTTAWLELGKNAPIGQEFELVVPNELEFQLTLNAKLQKPPPRRVVESPTKLKVQKPSTFSRVFASPKKRKELEMRQREEEQRAADQQQSDMLAKRMSQQPTAWDLLSPLAAEDGSFGRSYVCLKDHEQHCFGRPYVVDVTCFNEWATEEVGGISSVKSKTGTTQTRRRAPYKIGKLELQLLFVPRPSGAKDDDIPKSMNSCIRAMKDAEEALARNHSGYLSQQGGDCPYWRRRLFKLNGSKLTAYHESTGQPRATINLANASKLIDDRRALTQKETTGKGGSRRKSGFAEEEEGYMFVEEGFRIRFGNGEVIDFYADTAKDKEGWMKVLDQCIGTSSEAKGGPSWCDLVLKREGSLKRKELRKASGDKPPRYHSRTKSMVV